MAMPTQPRLRLVGGEVPHTSPLETPARELVAGENRRAARNLELQPTDPRWVLAVRASSQLQGTALTLERRQRVMRTAQQLGVRAFDANLIIAIVQDHARRGRTLSQAAGTIALLETPSARRADRAILRWVAAVAAAVAANAFLIWWLTG